MSLRAARYPALASPIRGLHHADASERRRAAREIFRHGLDLVRPVVELWLRDPGFTQIAGLDLPDSKSWRHRITVGLAVDPLTFARIRAANASLRLARVPPEHDAIEFELDFPPGVRLAILTPRRPHGNGAIARFIRKFGEGIQQVEFRVTDVARATETLRANFGLVPVYPAARHGAGGARVNFFLVPARTRRKVLIELVELPRGNAPRKRA